VSLEIEKCCAISGCCLGRYEAAMGSGDADVTMPESLGACEDGGWLRQCHLLAGKPGLETGEDQATAGREECAGAPDGGGQQQPLTLHPYPP
jgi:hypothetical protein